MDEDDETWYFINAKRIKIPSQNVNSKKLVVIVHVGCLKQVEINRNYQDVKGDKL
jgi:hypothetical protein